MPKCERCASSNVRWFTPRRYAERAAVLLCMECQRLTIMPPRSTRKHARETVALRRAA